jgi:WD40 repeat protein
VATGKELNRVELAGQKDATVDGLCYSPDGRLLAVGGRGADIRCVDSETGKETARFVGQQVDYASQLAFSPDGKRLAVAHGHGVRLWEVGTGKELLPSGDLSHGVAAVAFSPDGNRLAFSDGRWLRLYDVTTRRQQWRSAEDRDHAQRIAFAPDGKTLAAGNVSRLHFYDARTGKVTHSWGRGLGTSYRPGDSIELDLFTPDLEKVISLHFAAFGDPTPDVFVRSARTGKELLKFQRRAGKTTAASISPDGQVVAIGDREGPIHLYRLTSGNWAGQLDATGTDWHRLAFAPDGRSLASMDPNHSLQLLELATGKARLRLPESGSRREFVFSPDGNVLATWEGKTVELWDTFTGRKLSQLEGHAGRVTQAAFTRGGSILATASEDTTILLWEVTARVRGEESTKPTPEALAAAWTDLADPDAARAYRAMGSFRRAGPQGVDFLGARIRPEQMPAAKQIERWLKDLDDAEFIVREEASHELEKHLEVLAPTLRSALAGSPQPEARRRLTELIELAEGGAGLRKRCGPFGPLRYWNVSVPQKRGRSSRRCPAARGRLA